MTNARQMPGWGDGHAWNRLSHKNCVKHFPAKVYCRVNILYNLPLSLRDKTVYNELLENMYLYCKQLTKTKTLSTLGTGYFLTNISARTPICPNRKKQFPQNTKNCQSAKINSRKFFLPHGRRIQIQAVENKLEVNTIIMIYK